MVKFYMCVMKIMVKWQAIIIFIIIIMELISQNHSLEEKSHFSTCLRRLKMSFVTIVYQK